MDKVVDVVPYEIGMSRFFGQTDIGRAGLLHGWSDPEEAHVWNDGPEAALRLITRKPRTPYRLTFEGEPFLSKGCPRQDMTLFVNGLRLGFWRLTEPRPHTLSVVIEPQQMFDRNGMTTLNLVWYLPTSVRPADVGLGSDYRELGVCFRMLTITAEVADG